MKRLFAAAILVPSIIFGSAGVASAHLKPNLGPPIARLAGTPRFYWLPGLSVELRATLTKNVAAINAAGGIEGHKLRLKRVSCTPYDINTISAYPQPDGPYVDYLCPVVVGVKGLGPVPFRQDVLVIDQGHAWELAQSGILFAVSRALNARATPPPSSSVGPTTTTTTVPSRAGVTSAQPKANYKNIKRLDLAVKMWEGTQIAYFGLGATHIQSVSCAEGGLGWYDPVTVGENHEFVPYTCEASFYQGDVLRVLDQYVLVSADGRRWHNYGNAVQSYLA
jgi:hypothetical protein